MGTNYYYQGKIPPNKTIADRADAIEPFSADKPLHLGKASFGWCFALHIHPSLGINNLEDWEKIFREEGGQIKDEYDFAIDTHKMLEIIKGREDFFSSPLLEKSPEEKEKWLQENYAEEGPQGLARCIVSETTGCVAHGDGAYDLLDIDFS